MTMAASGGLRHSLLPTAGIAKDVLCALPCRSLAVTSTTCSGMGVNMPPDAMSETFDQAETFTPEPPRSLVRDLPPPDPFPVDALGPLLTAAALGIHDKTQAPVAICGSSVLAAAALAAQAHADVELPTGQRKPLSLFLVSVAASGERKSTVDGEAVWPVR